jgi:hypothetical protein
VVPLWRREQWSVPRLSTRTSLLNYTLQLLGREYYQTSFGERFLILGPLAVHTMSSLIKRLLLLASSPAATAQASPSPRRITSLLSLTGYASMLVFVPIHFLTHRVYPADTTPPILAVGPSELDYEFVKMGVWTWPVRSWMLYAGLVGCVALHASEGSYVLWRTWIKGSVSRRPGHVGRRTSRRTRRVVAVVMGVVLPVLSGLCVLSLEPISTLSSITLRYEAAFRQSIFYRIQGPASLRSALKRALL